MDVRVNGESRVVEDDASVASLLTGLGFDPSETVVERNGAIVPREAFAAVNLTEGDALEIIHFVGGG